MPALERALVANELTWSKVRLIARVATAEDEEAWIDADILADAEQAQDPIPPEERQMCAPDIDTEATQELVFRVPHDVAALFRAVRETLRERLRPETGRWLLDGEVFDAMLDGALLTWTLREPRSRAPDPVIEREGYRCAVPGCTSRRNLHDHHVIFRSHQGSDDASNRIALCAFHHQRCVHMRLMRIRGLAPDTIVFELPVASYRYGDVAVSQAEASRLDEVQIAA